MKVDGIEVSIESSAAKANAELDKLIAKLSSVSAAIVATKSTSGNFSSMANGVQKLGDAMQSISGVGLPAFNRLAKGIDRLGTVDTASIQRSASAITLIGKAFNNLGPVSSSAVQFGELAKNLSKFGYKSAGSAVENIPKLATALSQLMGTLSKAPTVSQNLIQMTNALANLASHGKAAGTASKSLSSGLNMFSTSAVRARKSSTSLAAAFGKFYATYWLLIRAASKFKDAIDISSDLTEVQNVVDTTFGKYTALVEKMSENSIQEFGMSELTVKQVSSRFQAMGSAMGFAQGKMANMSIELTKLAADMASFYNVEQSDVAEDLESIFTGQTRPMRAYGQDLTEATLQEWALKHGMDADIESMTQMEKVLLRYNYVMDRSSMAIGDFARTADTWANQTRILKQSFEQLASIIGGTLINTFKPFVAALNVVLQKVIVFAEKVSEALGAIFGWKYESNTAGIVTDFDDLEDSTGGTSDNLADAAKNAKKLRNTIFGYDELNVRTDNDSGSSSSGSAGTSGSSSSGGLVETDSILKKYQSEIKNLFELGETIGKSLTDAMNGINWESIYKGAKDFGKGLADFLNGLISPELFGATGRTIAGALNTAIYAALSFGQEFDFYNLGVSLATGINEFFAATDWESFANTLDTWIDGFEDFLKGGFDTLEWQTIFGGIAEFLGNLDSDTIEILLGAYAFSKFGKSFRGAIEKGIMDAFSGFSLAGLLKGMTAGLTGSSGFATLIYNALSGLGPAMLGELSLRFERWADGTILDPMEWEGVGGDIVRAINKIGYIIEGHIEAVFDGIRTFVGTWLGKIFSWENTKVVWDDAKKNFEKGGVYILAGIGEGLVSAIGFLAEPVISVFTGLWDALCATFGIHSPATSMKPIGEYILLGIIQGFTDTVKEFREVVNNFYNNTVKPWFSKETWTFPSLKDGITSTFESAFSAIKSLWNSFSSWLNSKLTINIDTSTLIGKGVSNLLGTSTIKLANLPTFSTGGFPEDGLFMANHDELVGKFSNGKTAVVNNPQIIEGVAQGVKSAVVEGMMEFYMATQGGGNAGQGNSQPVQMVVDGRILAEITYSQLISMARQGLIPKFV